MISMFNPCEQSEKLLVDVNRLRIRQFVNSLGNCGEAVSMA